MLFPVGLARHDLRGVLALRVLTVSRNIRIVIPAEFDAKCHIQAFGQEAGFLDFVPIVVKENELPLQNWEFGVVAFLGFVDFSQIAENFIERSPYTIFSIGFIGRAIDRARHLVKLILHHAFNNLGLHTVEIGTVEGAQGHPLLMRISHDLKNFRIEKYFAVV